MCSYTSHPDGLTRCRGGAGLRRLHGFCEVALSGKLSLRFQEAREVSEMEKEPLCHLFWGPGDLVQHLMKTVIWICLPFSEGLFGTLRNHY